MQPIVLPYQDPLEVAAGIDENCWALLYSGMESSGSGEHSILALYPEDEVIADNFAALESKLSHNNSKYENFWIGYLSYGLKNSLEKLPQDAPSFINLPLLRFVKFGEVYIFDKKAGTITSLRGKAKAIQYRSFCPELLSAARNDKGAKVKSLNSNMTDAEYLSYVEKFRQHIKDGDIFQANLTRKFFGEISSGNRFELFRRLCAASPAPYSAFMKFGDDYVISSSPEKFITIDAEGFAESLPIKGTAKRGNNAVEDEVIRRDLEESTKNKAENLMIVDLMRSDFAKGCEAGSVEVSDLFRVDTYETLHHMSSRISGKKRGDVSTLRFVQNCFPPGSMTGAPKIRAMEICTETEKMARGVYSGALGWFGGDGSADLSVVIRTLLVSGNKYEFQVGGAITFDSTSEGELEETLTKAKGICTALGLNNADLVNIK